MQIPLPVSLREAKMVTHESCAPKRSKTEEQGQATPVPSLCYPDKLEPKPVARCIRDSRNIDPLRFAGRPAKAHVRC